MKEMFVLFLGVVLTFYSYSMDISMVVSDSFATELPKYTSEYACKSSYSDLGIKHDDGSLYTFAFNTGQANFIILKKNNSLVIIDAGKGQDPPPLTTYQTKLQDIFCNCDLKAVFITHPHKDHYSLFFEDSNFGLSNYISKNTKIILGGKEKDWHGLSESKFLKAVGKNESNIEYIANKEWSDTKYEIKLLTDVHFYVFGLQEAKTRENQLSLPIQVTYKDKKILFPGDAEGDTIDRLQSVGHNLHQLYDLYSLKAPKDRCDIEKKFLELYNGYDIIWLCRI